MTGNSKDSGYVLGYFMAFLMIFVIFITAVMTMAFGYYSRSMKDKYQKQAFYTARSMAQVLAGELTSGTRNSNWELLPDQLPLSEEIVLMGLPKEMGTCTLYTEYEEETKRLYLWVTASIQDQKQTVAAVLYWEKLMENHNIFRDYGEWKLKGYIGREKVDEILEE